MENWKTWFKGKKTILVIPPIIFIVGLLAGWPFLQHLLSELLLELFAYGCIEKFTSRLKMEITVCLALLIAIQCNWVPKLEFLATSETGQELQTEAKESGQELELPDTLPDEDEIRTSVAVSTPQQIEKELQQNQTYVPDLQQEELQSILVFQTNFRAEITDSSEYMEKAIGFLREQVQGMLGTVQNCPAEEMNGNRELSHLLQEANEINLELQKGRTVGNYEALMRIYEEAYELAKSSAISLQLARPYAEIVEIYPRDTQGNCDRAFQYGRTGIRYFLETLSYDEIYHEEIGDILYRIGQIYHYLGDVPYLDTELRLEMYLTAVAYLELADEYPLDSYKGYHHYYAGMVCHKLGIVSREWNVFFLERAASRYGQAVEQKGFSTTILADAHKFRADVYDRLANLEGNSEKPHISEEYKALAQEERQAVKVLRGS